MNDTTQPDPPTCPRCGNDMVLRQGPRQKFWGCSQYPACRTTREHGWYDTGDTPNDPEDLGNDY
jgi:ssDNA-binding Zn-finger/Zn-ribbon topoisomerase 1